ncbi:MAG: hypothetical protein P4K94_11625 [Terracidiphilus sp.]|nr:hypothetical protein [Terracidiphilus sp.]
MEKSKEFSVSPRQDHESSVLSGCNPGEIDRRQFGRLVASAGAAALLPLHPVLSGAAESSAPARPAVTLRTLHAAFTIDATGALSAIACKGRNVLAPGQPAPLLSLRAAGKLHAPNRAAWNAKNRKLTLGFDGIGATAVVAVGSKPSHLAFELTGLRTAEPVELALWGPYPLSIGDLVGEVVGVVRDSESAVGIQALNVKTLGGYPSVESDIAPDGVAADDSGIYPGLPDELRKRQNWRGDTARHTEFGSSLQAYCRNRDRSRVISNWGHEKFVALPFADGGVVGSKIALFAVPAGEALPTLGAIEVAEDLPHPMIDGVWAKMSPRATASYLIVDFGEDTIDRAIEMTQRAGLKILYHSSPFETWGHFQLKPGLFPRGRDGFRNCVEKARRAGLGVGFHTLSNFITPNDPYVTPRPDPRLAQIGTSQLTAGLDAVQTEIPVSDPSWFQQKSVLHTVVLGEELVRFDAVSPEAPWRLLGCQRGAWGTVAAAHANGADAAMLMDHGYKVFLTDAALSVEVAHNIAAFCNETGAVQLSLDGLEGNWSTGMGQYGCSLFTSSWYDALSPALRGHVINDASNPHHFAWHIATRYNWGEPWYAGFRQSQTLLRLKNQLFYKRNLIPPMLGWFSLRPDTTLEDVEWLCARAAGFDAGFALVTSFDSKATQTSASVTSLDSTKAAIFDVVRQWETARESGAFPESVKPALQDVSREFRLVAAGPGEWELQPLKPAGPPLRVKAQTKARAHLSRSA